MASLRVHICLLILFLEFQNSPFPNLAYKNLGKREPNFGTLFLGSGNNFSGYSLNS